MDFKSFIGKNGDLSHGLRGCIRFLNVKSKKNSGQFLVGPEILTLIDTPREPMILQNGT